MQKIGVYSIAKEEKDSYAMIVSELAKMTSRYAKIEDVMIFDKKIAKAQSVGGDEAKESYATAFEPLLSTGYAIALDPLGKNLDTEGFAKLIEKGNPVNFFIGGAYGFPRSFITKCDEVVGLGALTMSHKVAKVVLFEQLYRVTAGKAGHPYHKI
jgi:23S rRNA (pseudouridine1915-N3)-methyltransferase